MTGYRRMSLFRRVALDLLFQETSIKGASRPSAFQPAPWGVSVLSQVPMERGYLCHNGGPRHEGYATACKGMQCWVAVSDA